MLMWSLSFFSQRDCRNSQTGPHWERWRQEEDYPRKLPRILSLVRRSEGWGKAWRTEGIFLVLSLLGNRREQAAWSIWWVPRISENFRSSRRAWKRPQLSGGGWSARVTARVQRQSPLLFSSWALCAVCVFLHYDIEHGNLCEQMMSSDLVIDTNG